MTTTLNQVEDQAHLHQSTTAMDACIYEVLHHAAPLVIALERLQRRGWGPNDVSRARLDILSAAGWLYRAMEIAGCTDAATCACHAATSWSKCSWQW